VRFDRSHIETGNFKENATMDFTALDTSQSTRDADGIVDCLKRNGINAVGRYYTRNRSLGKLLTAAEALALSTAGIKIWAVYQIRQNQVSDFSRPKGQAAAKDAVDYALNVISQPKGTGIYFSVDYDAADDFASAIRPYFEGVKDALAAAGSPYRIGVYGSGAICKGLLDAGLVELTWLSQSKAFAGTAEFKASNRWNINQRLGVKAFCDFDDEIDPNDINPHIADFGGFLLSSTPQPTANSNASIAAASSPVTLKASAVFPNVPIFRGAPVHRGETGSDDVKAVQSKLNDLKYGPLVTDGDFGEATQNAVYHFQARNATPAGQPLDISGEADAATWAALFGPGAVYSSDAFNAASPLRQLVIDIAASQIGVCEQPRGSNRGPEVDQYIRSVGLNPADASYPWCACFLYWVFDQAAKLKRIENPLPKTAGVHVLWNKGKDTEANVIYPSNADSTTVKPGMIFMIDTGGGHGHAGLVCQAAGDHLITIEGNTNPGGSSEGYGVFRRDARPISMGRLLGYLDFCDIQDPLS
jgi:hypothetical protein